MRDLFLLIVFALCILILYYVTDHSVDQFLLFMKCQDENRHEKHTEFRIMLENPSMAGCLTSILKDNLKSEIKLYTGSAEETIASVRAGRVEIGIILESKRHLLEANYQKWMVPYTAADIIRCEEELHVENASSEQMLIVFWRSEQMNASADEVLKKLKKTPKII